MKTIERLADKMDTVNRYIGKYVAWFIIPLALITIFEVIMRYVFDRPTIWVWDLSLQIFGVLILLGGGYTLLVDKHVNIDIVQTSLPTRPQMIFKMLAMLMIMYFAIMLIWQGGIMGWQSLMERERINSLWAPPIYQIKMLIPIGAFLIFFQALAKFFRYMVGMVYQPKVSERGEKVVS